MSECTNNNCNQLSCMISTDRMDPTMSCQQPRFREAARNSGPEWIAHARELIQAQGVRDPTGYTTPEEYTRIQCGCKRGLSEGNSTCARFLAGR